MRRKMKIEQTLFLRRRITRFSWWLELDGVTRQRVSDLKTVVATPESLAVRQSVATAPLRYRVAHVTDPSITILYGDQRGNQRLSYKLPSGRFTPRGTSQGGGNGQMLGAGKQGRIPDVTSRRAASRRALV